MVNGVSNAEVEALIKIADASVKERRGHWYTLGIPINHLCYNLDEQLNAIRKLGLSRNSRALEYLRGLNKVEFYHFYGNPSSEDGRREWHPLAKGELYKTLDALIPDWYEEGYYRPRYKEVKEVLREAISQLELVFK